MRARLVRCSRVLFVVMLGLWLPAKTLARNPSPHPPGQDPEAIRQNSERQYHTADLDVFLTGPDGTPIKRSAVITLLRLNGQFYKQGTTKEGYARFGEVAVSEFTAQVVAPGYERVSKQFEVTDRTLVKLTVVLTPLSDAEDAAADVAISALSPKVQKEIGKALEALRAKKTSDARSHLEAAQKAAPASAEVEYLFGVYSSQLNDPVQAQAHWMKTLELNPKHLNALLSVSNGLLQEKKAAEATPYLTRAVESEPLSWRAHALLAEADLIQGSRDNAIKQGERAIDLGHERAASVQLLVVRALAERGDREQAISRLQAYVQAHPADADAAKQLERWKNPDTGDASGDAASVAGEMSTLAAAATSLPVPSNWLPPDVDEKIPPVESGPSCAVDDVVSKAGKQLLELIADVDRFAATESLTHESINKYGISSAPEKRKFDYVVSIQEIRHGYLNVEEYRTSVGAPAAFPDGVETKGLPALVLIFHPYNAVNFEMNCEGLARWNGGLAWQVHFKQRPDKPNTIKSYRIGADGPSYPVALKGRAWISADTYQIVRLETDLVAPVPQIRLAVDHSAIEYGPVKFEKGNVSMWLPQSAEIYYDWKGRRIHRRHSFSKYMLFAVDDRQKISVPKVDDVPADGAPNEAPKEKPQQ